MGIYGRLKTQGGWGGEEGCLRVKGGERAVLGLGTANLELGILFGILGWVARALATRGRFIPTTGHRR